MRSSTRLGGIPHALADRGFLAFSAMTTSNAVRTHTGHFDRPLPTGAAPHAAFPPGHINRLLRRYGVVLAAGALTCATGITLEAVTDPLDSDRSPRYHSAWAAPVALLLFAGVPGGTAAARSLGRPGYLVAK